MGTQARDCRIPVEPLASMLEGLTLGQMGMSQPDYGHLLDDMFWLENQPVPTGKFLQPRVESGDRVRSEAADGRAGDHRGRRRGRLTDVDLRLSGCTLHRNGVLVGTGAGGAVFGSPLTSLTWLTNTGGSFSREFFTEHKAVVTQIEAAAQQLQL